MPEWKCFWICLQQPVPGGRICERRASSPFQNGRTEVLIGEPEGAPRSPRGSTSSATNDGNLLIPFGDSDYPESIYKWVLFTKFQLYTVSLRKFNFRRFESFEKSWKQIHVRKKSIPEGFLVVFYFNDYRSLRYLPVIDTFTRWHFGYKISPSRHFHLLRTSSKVLFV